MKSKGVVVYKGIEKRDGGTFKNAQGQDIKYDSSYVVKFDENMNNQINERKVKFPASNTYLYEKFSKFKPYTEVLLTCNIQLSNNACKLVPIDVGDVPDNYVED